jgi:hypothetical protein
MTNLRIEGSTDTIYEGCVYSGPTTITTASGGTHLCDGTNDGANPQPGDTPTCALNAAASACGFTYDGTFDSDFDDYSITAIGGSEQTATEFWGILVNYQFTPVSGCQFEDSPGDNILWAFNAFNANYFLELSLSASNVSAGESVTASVKDGMTGVDIPDASVGGATTGANGEATLAFSTPGIYSLKASRSDSIRSNAVIITVT